MRRLLLVTVLCLGCGGPAPLTVDMPLHLEDYLDDATIVASDVPEDLPEFVEWRFDGPQSDWKAAEPFNPTIQPVDVTHTGDALRVMMTEATRDPYEDGPEGYVFVEVPLWSLEDWAFVLVRARTSDNVATLGMGFNLKGSVGTATDVAFSFRFFGDQIPVINDGSVHTYRMRADYTWGQWEGPWRQLGLWFYAKEPASIDLLSVRVTTKEGDYTDASSGTRAEVRDRVLRRALYTHAPGQFEYRVEIPEAGRLDFAMGVLREDSPVNFRVTATPDGPRGRE